MNNSPMTKRSGKSHSSADARPQGRLIGYARVSTDDQNLELQIKALTAAGVTLDNLHTEHISGVAETRQGLDAAMLDCRAGDTLVVWKLDRFGRSISDIYERLKDLDGRGVGFRSLTDSTIDTTSAMGRLVLAMLAAFAAFERDLISERTRAGMQRLRDEGIALGRRPKMTKAQIAEGRKLRKEGLGQKAIAKRLGVHYQTVKRWVFTKR